ncbi:hypothetical protein [Cytobacillus firmus]|uniref:hypothetical protein n=1 Tax=Cytobacillus firmus TaxID=1399 RepID=UPI002815FD48|nr:hypothetical protein [Cytobacillus firmus]
MAISFDGETWRKASLKYRGNEKYSWVKWHFNREADKGEYTILVRAADSEGNIQPIKPYWNRKGYGYNAVQKIKIQVE